MRRANMFWAGATLVTAMILAGMIWVLEGDRASVETRVLATPAGDVILSSVEDMPDMPVVVIAHGFAGSVQMMQTITRDLARQGYLVASFDYIGHGRHKGLLSPQVTEIEGTTRQLISQTQGVVDAVLAEHGEAQSLSLLGHSMATDIMIRAASARDDVDAVVAISMYSEAVTSDFPQRLLVLSGEWEDRLRVVGLEVARMIDPTAQEGQTVTNGNITRRAAFVAGTEHVAVLYSETTLAEIRAWLGQVSGLAPESAPRFMGLLMAAMLGMIVVLNGVSQRAFGPALVTQGAALGGKAFLLATLLPAAAGVALSFLAGPALGVAGFGALGLFLLGWGGVALACLWRAGRRPAGVDLRGFLTLGVFGFLFAIALDRYGAAFLPTGQRVSMLGVLLPGALCFILADRLLLASAPIWQRIVARLVPVAALLCLMFLRPDVFGLLFTVLPVLCLFYLVYGTMAHFVAVRYGPTTAGLGAGVWLAWALAASTPLFAV
ncbi:MAG: alpha/beta fold hydrolase [Roseobacter sp.]